MTYKISYDEVADVLYISRSGKADSTFIDENFIAVRKNKQGLVGLTVDGYKDRIKNKTWNIRYLTKYLPDLVFDKFIKE